MEYITESTSLP